MPPDQFVAEMIAVLGIEADDVLVEVAMAFRPKAGSSEHGPVNDLNARMLVLLGHRERSPHSARLYTSDWVAFVSWCEAAGRSPVPVDPDTVTAYLTSLADTLR